MTDTTQLILQQGGSFDFSTVVELMDPSSLTIANFLDMYQLERLLFIELLKKLSPLRFAEAEAAYKRADRLAQIAVKAEKIHYLEQRRSSMDSVLVGNIEQRRLMWEASPAQKPQNMEEYDWKVRQKQLNPTCKNKAPRSLKKKTSQSNNQQEDCAVVADSQTFAGANTHTTSNTYNSNFQTPTAQGRDYIGNEVLTLSSAASSSRSGLDSRGGGDGDGDGGGGGSGVQGVIGPARGQGIRWY